MYINTELFDEATENGNNDVSGDYEWTTCLSSSKKNHINS